MGPSAPKHGQIRTLLMTFPSWSLSRPLLMAILEDRLSDQFVAQLVWERLGYRPSTAADGIWRAGPQTPADWSEAFPEAPPVIATRPASVRLTRSIPKPYKQLLKEQLHFTGYRIGELYPGEPAGPRWSIGCWLSWRLRGRRCSKTAICRRCWQRRSIPCRATLGTRLWAECASNLDHHLGAFAGVFEQPSRLVGGHTNASIAARNAKAWPASSCQGAPCMQIISLAVMHMA